MTRLSYCFGCLSAILLELLHGDELGLLQIAVGLPLWWLRSGRLHDSGQQLARHVAACKLKSGRVYRMVGACIGDLGMRHFAGEKFLFTDLTLDDFSSGISIGINSSWQLMGYTFTLQKCNTLSWTQFVGLLGQTWAILGARQSYLPHMGSRRCFLVRTGDSCLVRIVFGFIIGLVIVGCLQILALDNCPKEHCLVAEFYSGFRGAFNGTNFGEGTSS